MTTEEKKKPERVTMTHAEWKAEATRRFGPNVLEWRFVCPACGMVCSVGDYKLANAPEGAVGFSCIGRYFARTVFKAFGKNDPRTPLQPCDYTGGGLFGLNPITVKTEDGKTLDVFAFAEPEQKPEQKDASHG